MGDEDCIVGDFGFNGGTGSQWVGLSVIREWGQMLSD